jgi:hypothetical protein
MKTQGTVSFLPRATTRVALFVTTAFLLIGDVPAWAADKKKKEHEPNGLERVGNFFFRIARRLEQPDFSRSEREREERDAVIIYNSRRAEPPPVVREGPGTGLSVPPGYMGGNVYYDYPPPPGVTARVYSVRPVPPPVYQTYPEPHLRYPERIEEPRSSMTLPVPSENSVSRQSTVPPRPGLEPQGPAYNPDAPFDPPVNSARTRPDADVRSRVDNPSPPSPSQRSTAPEPSAKAAQPDKAEAQFATRVPGKPGFVYPPGVEQSPKNMLDVRDFSPAQKVKDPRTGKVFLVPPK